MSNTPKYVVLVVDRLQQQYTGIYEARPAWTSEEILPHAKDWMSEENIRSHQLFC